MTMILDIFGNMTSQRSKTKCHAHKSNDTWSSCGQEMHILWQNVRHMHGQHKNIDNNEKKHIFLYKRTYEVFNMCRAYCFHIPQLEGIMTCLEVGETHVSFVHQVITTCFINSSKCDSQMRVNCLVLQLIKIATTVFVLVCKL